MWIRGEIAPQEQFLLYSTIFLTKGVKLYVHLWNLVVQLVFSSILQIWYVEVRISRSVSEGHFDFEITRVDCSILAFKRKLNSNLNAPPKYFCDGKRLGQIYHARLRTICSSLNHHLFTKNIVDSPLCTCGSVEDTHRFLFSCYRNTNLRVELFEKIVPICTPTLGVLLFGNCELSSVENKKIFLAVQAFLLKSKRFQINWFIVQTYHYFCWNMLKYLHVISNVVIITLYCILYLLYVYTVILCHWLCCICILMGFIAIGILKYMWNLNLNLCMTDI